jgi:phosphinothricin acetyltransferase
MNDSLVSIRPATADDAPAIAGIYNQGIEERTSTFETRFRTPDDVATDLAKRGERYPTVVAERDGIVQAVAWCSQYRPRECYAGIADFSIYVDRSARRTGVGRAAMLGLIEQVELRGFWKLASRVFPENTASLALLGSLGFREVGVYRHHGRLDGVWRNCVILELLLGEAATPDVT